MSTLEWHDVFSSNVEAVAYSDGQLYVRFGSGTYEYDGVPEDIYEGVFSAQSVGRYLRDTVIGKYPYRKL